MSATDLHFATITELGRRLRSREISAVELAEHFLARIDRLDGRLGAFKVVCRDRALAQARAAQTLLDAGCERGPLHGIPYVAKDLYDVRGLPTTAGTHLLDDNLAQRDSAVVRRLSRSGMVLLGKTVTVQFAYGGAGINHDHGTPHNPWHQEPHLPGGSSSGSGVAVAAGMAPMGLGTDTGGSVRIPAAHCGITGLKTTVGQVSRAGIYPLSWSLDSAGPLSRDTIDAALVYDAIQGPDNDDPTTVGRAIAPIGDAVRKGVKGLRLGVPEAVFWEDVDPEVDRLVRAAIEDLRSLGATIVAMPFPEADAARELNPRGLVIAAEAYAVNRRFVDDHFDELDPAVAHRVVLGRDVAAHEYLATANAWKDLRQRTVAALSDIDALLCPTVMVPPVPVADADSSTARYSERNLQCLRNTAIGNILDLCGLTVPVGLTTGGLPVGLMIYGKPFDEATVTRVGHAYEREREPAHPDLSWLE